MRQRVFLFLLSLLAVTALTACGSAEKAAEVPPLSEVEAMTDEEATEALAGFRRQDLLDAWGSPRTYPTPCPACGWTSMTPPRWAAG